MIKVGEDEERGKFGRVEKRVTFMQDFVRFWRGLFGKYEVCLKQNKYNGLCFDDAASEFFWCLATLHVLSPAGNGMALLISGFYYMKFYFIFWKNIWLKFKISHFLYVSLTEF